MAVLPPNISEQNDSKVKVTGDGGVSKKVLIPGSGPQPPLHARCLVHYIGRLKQTGEVFMDTRATADGAEPHLIVAGRDSALRETGLNLAVSTMRQGETCSLDVKAKYGYGSQGSFSFPMVPPNADLEYEVELIAFDEVTEGKERSSMTYEERLEAAERRRLEGNKLFEGTEFADALGKYAMALSFMDQDFMVQLEGPHEAKANAVRLPTLLNMAACHLQLKDYNGAISAATQVLAVEADNAKALFRRGRARHLLGQSEAARTDLQAALKRSPRNPAIVKELQMVERSMKADQKAADQLFKGRLAPPPQQQQATIQNGQQEAMKLSQKVEPKAFDLLAKGGLPPTQQQQSQAQGEQRAGRGEQGADHNKPIGLSPNRGVSSASQRQSRVAPPNQQPVKSTSNICSRQTARTKLPFWRVAWDFISRCLGSFFFFAQKQGQSHAHLQ